MADPVISAKLIVLYRFLSHHFPRSKTMWFLANSSIWHRKMLLNLTIPHPTTSLNVFLSQFPSFSSCLEQRTVRNTRGPFLVLFSFMKEQVFVPKTPNIFAIMTGPPSSTVPQYFVYLRAYIFDIRADRKRSRAKPTRAENPSARATARASSARAHH